MRWLARANVEARSTSGHVLRRGSSCLTVPARSARIRQAAGRQRFDGHVGLCGRASWSRPPALGASARPDHRGKSHRTWSQTTSKSWVLTPSKDSGWGSTPSSVASFPPSFTAR